MTAIMAALGVGAVYGKDNMTERLRSLSGEKFDHAFLQEMIEHHQQGLEMAKMALDRAQTDAVKRFAQQTSSKQEEDIKKMQSMLGGTHAGHHEGAAATSRTSDSANTDQASGNHGSGQHSDMSHHDMQGMKDQMMSKLQSAQGSDFDRAFTEEMLKHHSMAEEMAQLAQEKANSPEVKSMAAKMATDQSREIDELQRLKRSIAK